MINFDLAFARVYPEIASKGFSVRDDFSVFDGTGEDVVYDKSLVDAFIPTIELEESLKKLRIERNRLLAETDYLALADSTLTDEVRAYRQALRDLPANTTDPANPVWPVKPS